jgi:hypothetical protein
MTEQVVGKRITAELAREPELAGHSIEDRVGNLHTSKLGANVDGMAAFQPG